MSHVVRPRQQFFAEGLLALKIPASEAKANSSEIPERREEACDQA
jgi:hypothetical protein